MTKVTKQASKLEYLQRGHWLARTSSRGDVTAKAAATEPTKFDTAAATAAAAAAAAAATTATPADNVHLPPQWRDLIRMGNVIMNASASEHSFF